MIKELNLINFKSFLIRLLIFSIIWVLLTNADLKSLIVGIPFILISVIISIILLPMSSISLYKLIKFIPFFMYYSVKGAIDVSSRVFITNINIEPMIVNYKLSSHSYISKVFMINLISLLPGTLSVSNKQNNLIIHVLDVKSNYKNEIYKLENKVLDIFKK